MSQDPFSGAERAADFAVKRQAAIAAGAVEADGLPTDLRLLTDAERANLSATRYKARWQSMKKTAGAFEHPLAAFKRENQAAVQPDVADLLASLTRELRKLK